MYKTIKAVINTRDFELEDFLKKINAFWVHGKLTEEEHNELLTLAREKAIPENSYAGLQDRIDSMYKALAETRKELAELKERVKAMETGGEEEDTTDDPEQIEEYPEYVQPTGAHDAYYAGDKVTYNEKRYLCIAPEGVAVVWNPEVMPDYWQEYEELL
jgi:hypothetical protein